MRHELVYAFLSAGIATLCGVVSLIFFLLWKKGRDPFFSIFSLAFSVLGLERVILILLGAPAEFSPFIYLIRLAAFLLIIGAIVQKNRAGQTTNL